MQIQVKGNLHLRLSWLCHLSDAFGAPSRRRRPKDSLQDPCVAKNGHFLNDASCNSCVAR